MQPEQVAPQLPTWLPLSVARYLAHTEQGISIRELARRDGCHASTVLRQIRKLEAMRDDPLVDAALRTFRQKSHANGNGAPLRECEDVLPEESVVQAEGMRVLRRLCETGAVLAVASDMETAVVMRDETTRTAMVARQVAQAMALKGWITCVQAGRVSRYVISAQGRTYLSKMVAAAENQARDRAQGFAETQAVYGVTSPIEAKGNLTAHGMAETARFVASESPLTILARRRDREGNRFLSEDLVHAGERLREDYELAQMGTEQEAWRQYLQAPHEKVYLVEGEGTSGAEPARTRVVAALETLGEGLTDVALRCCCQLEGLEAAEKHLGWSARSGKVVLRIALMHLRDHYHAEAGGAGDYIG
ncbi:DUF6456 domain-containing protein [Shimia sagamensis]|uniref:DUF6456 domain-containing protein n=1 Tax=Shimia sagamensis TaxID=1566352 RepID=A0ABY1NP66_9RHOB|nr:DUF6456 domain-containing protein [Shimia sagamensis]SMP12582.1 hypothetical protein SAMN06265373_102363 [Shimia sagamensis]